MRWTALRVGPDVVKALDDVRATLERRQGLKLSRTAVAEAALRLGLRKLAKSKEARK